MNNNQTVVTPKAALKASGLNPTQAAVKANIGVTTVYRALKANRWPKHATVAEALKKALGVTELVTP